MAAALDNARIAGEFEEFQSRGRQKSAEQHHRQGMHVTHKNFNLIPAEEGEIGPAEYNDEDEDEQVPGLEIEGESSDDETYVDKEVEDIELTYDESEDEGASTHWDHTLDEQFQQTRSG